MHGIICMECYAWNVVHGMHALNAVHDVQYFHSVVLVRQTKLSCAVLHRQTTMCRPVPVIFLGLPVVEILAKQTEARDV